MRWLVGFVFVLALGVVPMVGCGEEGEPPIPCETTSDCPYEPYDCKSPFCGPDGVCRFYSRDAGIGCALSDGSVGQCMGQDCTPSSEPILCKTWDNRRSLPEGTLCRSPDGREGTCFDGVCGGEHFCEGVVCDEPDNLCGSNQFCNWQGICEFGEVTDCYDANTCTFDECDPDRGCVYTQRPDGERCATDELCCLFSLGTGLCCSGTCHDGVCR